MIEKVGERQYALLLRARRSKPYRLVRPYGYLEMRAVRRLVARGLLRPALGWPGCWTLTERSIGCPIKVTGGAR